MLYTPTRQQFSGSGQKNTLAENIPGTKLGHDQQCLDSIGYPEEFKMANEKARIEYVLIKKGMISIADT